MPTFVAEYEGDWTTTGRSKSVPAATDAGDVLVCFASDYPSPTVGPPSGGTNLAWTLRQYVDVSRWQRIWVWTATATTTETFTLTLPCDSNRFEWGFNCLRFTAADGIGASDKAAAGGAPSLQVTTQADHSALVVVVSDYSATNGSGRIWRTDAGQLTEVTYSYLQRKYTQYGGYHADAGTAGAKTVGLISPQCKYSIAAVEVLPAPPPPPGPPPGAFLPFFT